MPEAPHASPDCANAEVVLRGPCLHAPGQTRVALTRTEGPIRIRTPLGEVETSALRVTRTDRSVTVEHERIGRLDLVEHLFGALGGLSVYEGVVIDVDGPELPLLDGCALAWCRALEALSPVRTEPPLAVTRNATFTERGSTYRFETGAQRSLEVTVDFAGVGEQRATWDGAAATFQASVAGARTFGFLDEAALFAAAGRAAGVDPRVVMILDRQGRVVAPGAAAGEDELARHKLLDLIGDLYVYGGPPRGRVVADRPGHTATHGVVRRALDAGVLRATGG